MKLQNHPLADLFPDISDADKNELADDIKLNGLIHPIVMFEGKILDGRHRYEACLSVDVEPQFTEYKGTKPGAFTWSLNGNRRHLSQSQRAMIAASLENMPAYRPQNKDANWHTSRMQVADITGARPRSIARASKVLDESPALAKEVKNGHITVSGAVKQIEKQQAQKPQPSAPVELDKEGFPIPAKILPLWRRAEAEAREALQMVSKLRTTLKAAQENQDVAYCELRFQENAKLLDTLFSNFKLVSPHGVCTVCQGKVPESCTLCHGRGFLSSFAYQMFGSAEVKAIRAKLKTEAA